MTSLRLHLITTVTRITFLRHKNENNVDYKNILN